MPWQVSLGLRAAKKLRLFMATAQPWTREEIILAIRLYCQTPFGKIHKGNPDILGLADRIGRTPSSVALKMVNLAALDPTIPQKGMGNHSKLDAEVWGEFFANPDRFLDASDHLLGIQKPLGTQEQQQGMAGALREGTEYVSSVKTRRNQSFFREMVLSSYNYKCAITGIDLPGLLVASHIIPWSQRFETRIDPTNGLCLNALHDKAFDKGYISFSSDFALMVAAKTPLATRPYLADAKGSRLRLPDRFLPSQTYLEYHRDNIFLG